MDLTTKIKKESTQPFWSHNMDRKYNKTPIFISGSPRSGTSWVLEVLESAFNARRHREPFNYFISSNSTGFPFEKYDWLRPTVDDINNKSIIKQELKRVLTGGKPFFAVQAKSRGLPTWKSLKLIASADITFVKFVLLQRALSWIARNTDNPGIVILRNPISVVSSQLYHPFKNSKGEEAVHPDWSEDVIKKVHPIVREEYLDSTPGLRSLLERKLTTAERLAISACLDLLIPLQDKNVKGKYVFVAYESLVECPEKFIEIAKTLDLGLVFDFTSQKFKKPSKTTASDSNVKNSGDPRLSWKRRLSGKEAEDIFNVMDVMGVDFYSDNDVINSTKLKEKNIKHVVV